MHTLTASGATLCLSIHDFNSDVSVTDKRSCSVYRMVPHNILQPLAMGCIHDKVSAWSVPSQNKVPLSDSWQFSRISWFTLIDHRLCNRPVKICFDEGVIYDVLHLALYIYLFGDYMCISTFRFCSHLGIAIFIGLFFLAFVQTFWVDQWPLKSSKMPVVCLKRSSCIFVSNRCFA